MHNFRKVKRNDLRILQRNRTDFVNIMHKCFKVSLYKWLNTIK